jgi:hypothetical protein
MRFGLLCTANVETSQAVRDHVDFNVEAEALGFVSHFLWSITSVAGIRLRRR